MCMLVLVVLAIIAVIVLTIIKGGSGSDIQDAIVNWLIDCIDIDWYY